jgi:hypothetical protein
MEIAEISLGEFWQEGGESRRLSDGRYGLFVHAEAVESHRTGGHNMDIF